MMRGCVGLAMTLAVLLVASGTNGTVAQGRSRASILRISATSDGDARVWDTYVSEHERTGALRVRTSRQDPDVPSRRIERLEQFHRGIKVWGSDVVRNTERGLPISMFGNLAPELDLSTTPAIAASDARRLFLVADGARLISNPELVVLALPGGGFALAYMAAVATSDISRVFIDAGSGRELWRYSEMYRQSSVGTGQGVLGDSKKLSVLQRQDAFVTSDSHRPPVMNTYDMRGDLARAITALLGAPLTSNDLARDTDNVWSDVAVVDAHAHIAWTYDFFFKRFGRHGLDDRDAPIIALTNPVSQQDALRLTGGDINFAINAFWCSVCGAGNTGMMLFGNGIPANFSFGGQTFNYLAGALDIVAHELTHAVTTSTSNLIPSNESGALNEAFSDMMGTSVEFFFREQNVYRPQADYVIGEDVIRSARAGIPDGIRSMSNPALYGDPDHYRNKFAGAADNGGLHANTGIPNQAFYLAIEGGTNRTSGLSVPGVGAANRDQIEKAFYRAFTLMLPANATFSTARSATTQAARDLYGAGSRAEQMIDLAWNAVGVPNEASISTLNSSVGALTRTSFAFSMTSSGTYYINLRGNDASLDLDLYISPNTTACTSRWPLPASCVVAQSVTPEAVESVKVPVRTGESYRIWVDNLGARSSTFTVEHVVTP
jgi:bacillolysin